MVKLHRELRSKVSDVVFFFPLMEKCSPPPLFVLNLGDECYRNKWQAVLKKGFLFSRRQAKICDCKSRNLYIFLQNILSVIKHKDEYIQISQTYHVENLHPTTHTKIFLSYFTKIFLILNIWYYLLNLIM